MKPIEKQIKNFDIDINPAKDRQILNELCQTHAESVRSQRFSRISIWRIVMKRISVPMPIAACFCIIFCLQSMVQLKFYIKNFSADKPSITIINVKEESQNDYVEQSVYVPGTGFIKNKRI